MILKAKDPLFTWMEDEALRRPTYKSFIALLDNYETSTGKQEEVTPEEIRENWTFINNICDTKVCIYKKETTCEQHKLRVYFSISDHESR